MISPPLYESVSWRLAVTTYKSIKKLSGKINLKKHLLNLIIDIRMDCARINFVQLNVKTVL
jgi:hypothetical protein